MKSLKPLSLLAIAVLAGAAMTAWSLTWFVVELAPGAALEQRLTVSGADAAPAVVPFSLAALAIIAALAISRAIVRTILAVVLSGLGAGIAIAGGAAAVDARSAVISSVTQSIGLEGDRAVSAAISSISTSAWPAITAVAGALLFALGLTIAATTRRWPEPSSRYDAAASTRPTQNDGTTPDARGTSVSDWDSLSTGDDPTRPDR